MRQEIYKDSFGYDAWDQSAGSRCFIHIANSNMYRDITEKLPPMMPPTAEQYTNAGLPWFEYFDEELSALGGSEKLAELDSVGAKSVKNGEGPLPDNTPVQVENPIKLSPNGSVRDGKW